MMVARMLGEIRVLACTQLGLGLLLLGGVWIALPARWPVIDYPGTALGISALTVGAGLLARAAWATKLAHVVLWLELVLGTLTVSLLAIAAAQLAGSYGPIGGGGALLLSIVALLVVPYLVILPALQLGALRARREG
jgi:hypothetical protein